MVARAFNYEYYSFELTLRALSGLVKYIFS